MGNSCMGVRRVACQIREPTTPDKMGLDQGQIHSTRWPMMTEPDTLRHFTAQVEHARKNMDCHVLMRHISRDLNDKAFLGWWE